MQPTNLSQPAADPSKRRLGRGLEALGLPDPNAWSVVTDQLAVSQAQIRSLAAELQHAHHIICNALNLMTLEQKLRWGERNATDGVDGEGITRAHEREAALNMALRQLETVLTSGDA
ncbi:hypothetical protein [Chitiniphilus eburneus]|uniref:hypothetical protein n=1 Tax=Chitiniphilus eburneus TaxID=2571148 RepID=UPI0035D050A6